MPETTQFSPVPAQHMGEGTLKVNAVLNSRYKIMAMIGGGGMGIVYQARDLNFLEVKKFVAVKEMQTIQTDPKVRGGMLKQFRREANLLATLSHPAIPKIFDFFDVNDRAYLVMEFINGSDLELLMNKTKELPVEKIIEWAVELCDVLDYLHSQKPDPIVFRDMKASNVMVDNIGRIRLIDFGIAKAFVTGVVHTSIGTEGYSAPEQYKGNVTPQSDIYGLGATLHHLLTRQDPRMAQPFSFHERPILDFNPKVPPALVAVIDKALNINPMERWRSCLEMKDALIAVQRPGLVLAAPASPGAPPILINGAQESARLEAVNGASANGIAASAGASNGIAAPIAKPKMTGAFTQAEIDEFEDLHADNASAVQPRWIFKAEDEIRSSPAFARGFALVGAYDHNLWGLKIETGELAWKFPTRGGIATSPASDDSSRLAVFGSEDYSVYAVDFTRGRISWSYATKDKVRSSPRIAHEHVFVGSDDGKLYALGLSTGRFLWAFDFGSPVRNRPFVTNELIIAGCDTGEVMGITLSGQRKWSYRTKGPVLSSPLVDMNEGMCFVGSGDGYLYALDANSGYSSWRFRTTRPIYGAPAQLNNLIFFGSADGNVYAVQAASGREKWKFATDKAVIGSPVVHKDAVYIGSTDHTLYCLDANSGRERWRYKTGAQITSSPAIAGDLLLVASMDHRLYAFPLV